MRILFCSVLCISSVHGGSHILDPPQPPPQVTHLRVVPQWKAAQVPPDYEFFAPFSFTVTISDMLDREDGHLKVTDVQVIASRQEAEGSPCFSISRFSPQELQDCWMYTPQDPLFTNVNVFAGGLEIDRPNRITGNILLPDDALDFPRRGWLFTAIATDDAGAKTSGTTFFTLVPEPSSALLSLIGLVSLGQIRRRQPRTRGTLD